jgi:crotonobetainyl-CoA:carnitine CoA-transferase CaiB-like acyl-CoA transferase
MDRPSSALEGIRVIDLSEAAAAPMAARLLADWGADVIHVERPVMGDSARGFQTGGGFPVGVPSDINYAWENWDRSKRSVIIDISQEVGQRIIYKLAGKADVFVTNKRPYELEKFKLEYDTLSQINSRLIYACLNGYGTKGPERNSPGYDIAAAWARTGVPHLIEAENFRPAFMDNMAGMTLAYGIMTALFIRERSGVGQEVNVSLLSTGLFQASFDVAGALVTGRDYDEWKPRSREDGSNPLDGKYQTKDGRSLILAIIQPDPYWSQFCKAIEREGLEHDSRFESFQPRVENRVALWHILDEVFLSKTLDEWKPRLTGAGLPWSPVQNLREVINDPQARANDYFVAFDHPTYGRIEVLANPVKLSKTPVTIKMAPEFGQHTEEVLLEHGYSWEDISQLKQQGIIG